MDNIQHPCHPHPLKPVDPIRPRGPRQVCCICGGLADKAVPAYSCNRCRVFVHKPCAELQSPFLRHPFHPDHPLTLVHGQPPFKCSHCGIHFEHISKYSCADCGFYLDPDCATQGMAGDNSQSVLSNLHDHPLTRWSHTGFPDSCWLCTNMMGGKGYMCTELPCGFMFHEKCVGRLFYEDGSRIPQVGHRHQLITFRGKGKSHLCGNCDSAISGEAEYIGCPRCQLFYHRKCAESPDSLNAHLHCPHPLTLSIAEFLKGMRKLDLLCRSCGTGLVNQAVYSCSTCRFNLHIGCARRNE
ncbi:hypothetical protein MLD38_036354 [Melastoma candidum]|uniref:Uncharacterized protein n=1 Tax=Melastoma candidum TaxID=119954 RepID=A0ACB9LJE5_9MYRT|nr:hypothetical protein MLD38_036354 [Melastoma candidum]